MLYKLLTLRVLKLLPRGSTADNYIPTALYTAFCNLDGMPRWLFKMITAFGRKGWGARGGATTKVATRLAYWNFVELCVFTLATTNSFTAGKKRSIVTYNRSATLGKRRTTAVLLVPFDRCYRLRTVSLLTAAFSGVRDLSPPFLLDFERRELLINFL